MVRVILAIALTLSIAGCLAAAKTGEKQVEQTAGTAQAVQQEGAINLAYIGLGGGTIALFLWLLATLLTKRIDVNNAIEAKRIDAERDKREIETHEKLMHTALERLRGRVDE